MHVSSSPNALASLEVQDLALRRGGRLLLHDLSFRLDAGGAMIVTGPNGVGKSSLLRALAGLLEPAHGQINIPWPLAWLGHDNALKPTRRLRDELAFWARLDGVGHNRINAAMTAFHLHDLADVPVRLLSSGQKRRAALARVHASPALLWLLDEPSVGLDAASLGHLFHALQAHRAAGGAVIVSSHVALDLPGAVFLPLDRPGNVPRSDLGPLF